MHHENGFWFFGGHGFGMIFWWGLIIIGIIVLIRYFARQSPGSNPELENNEKPIEIAKRRLAKGEISQEEFSKLKKSFEK